MRIHQLSWTLALLALVATTAEAQQGNKGKRGPDKVPPGHLPPAGMCRVWIDGVPPGRQPRPTDCATARRDAPANSRIVYSDGSTRDPRAWERDRNRCERYDREGRCVVWRRDEDRDRDRDRPAYIPNRSESDRDGGVIRPDEPVRTRDGRAFPVMRDARTVPFAGGSNAMKEWTPDGTKSVRQFDGDRDGRAERAEFYDGDKRLTAIWFDRNEDGQIERIEWYRNGQLDAVYR